MTNQTLIYIQSQDYESRLKEEIAKADISISLKAELNYLRIVLNNDDLDDIKKYSSKFISKYSSEGNSLDKLFSLLVEINSVSFGKHDKRKEEKKATITGKTNLGDSIIEYSRHPSFRGQGKCWICGRDLDNEESVKRGIGPVCFKRVGGVSPLSDEQKKLSRHTNINRYYSILSYRRRNENTIDLIKERDIVDIRVISETEKGIEFSFNVKNKSRDFVESWTQWSPIKAVVVYNDVLFVSDWFKRKFIYNF